MTDIERLKTARAALASVADLLREAVISAASHDADAWSQVVHARDVAVETAWKVADGQ